MRLIDLEREKDDAMPPWHRNRRYARVERKLCTTFVNILKALIA